MDDSSTNPSAPEPPTDGHRGGSSLRFLWAFLLLLLLYLLSIGPAARIHHKLPAARPAIETVYKPLFPLLDHSDSAKTFYVWYLTKVWKVPGTTQTNSPAPPGK